MIDWNEFNQLFLGKKKYLENDPTFAKLFGKYNDPLPNMEECSANEFWGTFSSYGAGLYQGYRQIGRLVPGGSPLNSVHYFIYHGGNGFAIHVDWKFQSPQSLWIPKFYKFTLCKHERKSTMDTIYGWHEGHCTKCGLIMNYDSSD